MTNTRSIETIKAEIREWLIMEMFPELTIDVIIKYIEMAHIRGQMDGGKAAIDVSNLYPTTENPPLF